MPANQPPDNGTSRTTVSTGAHDVRPVPDPTSLTTQQLLREIESLEKIFQQRFVGYDKAIELLQASQDRQPTIATIATRLDDVKELHEAKIEELSALVTESRNALLAQFTDRLSSIKLTLEERFNGMDKAVEIRTNEFGRLVDAGIQHVQQLHEEKFRSIETQFKERDTRTEQTSKDSKVAVDAALQAAKEAVGEQNKSNALAIAKSENTFTKQIDQIGVLIATLQKSIDDKIDDIKGRLGNMEARQEGSTATKSGLSSSAGLIIAAIVMLLTLATVVIMVGQNMHGH